MFIISTIISIAITLLIFGIVVLAHEFGHFFAARRCGIFVEEFAIGMGPKLFSAGGGENKTLYSIRAIPIGGFCKMLEQDESEPEKSGALNNKSVTKRMLVMSAGSLLNFLLAFIIFFMLVILMGYRIPAARSVIQGTPAHKAGLEAGDLITHINGTRISLYEDFLLELGSCKGNPVDLNVRRGNTVQLITATPLMDENGDYKLGFYPEQRLGLLSGRIEGYKNIGFFDSLKTALDKIIFNIKMPVAMITRLITGQGGLPGGVAGPIGIAGIVNETYRETIRQSILDTILVMVNFCAWLSAGLGIMNLLPLPALDGGRLVFLTCEAIRRKPIPPEQEGAVHFVGFILLMILAVFIACRDIIKLL